MLFKLQDNYSHADERADVLEGKLNYHRDDENATVEINSAEDLIILTEVFGKVLVTKDHITYYVD